MICHECDKRDLCQTLCPEAEAYANQDYVAQHDRVGVRSNIKPMPDPEPSTKIPLSEKQRKIVRMIILGFSDDNIAKYLGITKNAVQIHKYRIRKLLS